MRHGGAKAQAIKLALPRAQADSYIRQAISISQWRQGHGRELIPTGKVTNAAVALVTVDTTAKWLAMNPIHDWTENRLGGAHFRILALSVPWKNAKRRRNQSHPICCANRSFSNPFLSQ
jgi:hypothetical protein